jgi:ABC-type branched-subunit amino acid transport system substrate-binding protein
MYLFPSIRSSIIKRAAAYLLILGVIAPADSSAPPKVRDALRSTDRFEGITGTITIDRDGSVHRPLFVNAVKEREFVQVTYHAAFVR